jgi:ubiquitin
MDKIKDKLKEMKVESESIQQIDAVLEKGKSEKAMDQKDHGNNK